MNILNALDNLKIHLDNAETTIDDWDVSEYKDAMVFSVKAPARSNRLYIVKGTQVKSFALSSQSVEEAYSELG